MFNNLCYLKNGVNTFVDKLLIDLEVDREQCEYWLNRSVGIVTALLPHLGYETASALAKEAYETGRAKMCIRDREADLVNTKRGVSGCVMPLL